MERGIKVSMDGKRRYLDNIFVERLWRSVKYEEVYLKAYDDGSEARRGIGAYLDFCNRERPHQSLGYRTPAQVFASGSPLGCLPEPTSTLSSREAVSDFTNMGLDARPASHNGGGAQSDLLRDQHGINCFLRIARELSTCVLAFRGGRTGVRTASVKCARTAAPSESVLTSFQVARVKLRT